MRWERNLNKIVITDIGMLPNNKEDSLQNFNIVYSNKGGRIKVNIIHDCERLQETVITELLKKKP